MPSDDLCKDNIGALRGMVKYTLIKKKTQQPEKQTNLTPRVF